MASLVPSAKPQLPEPPPHLEKCIRKGLPPLKSQKPTADDKVITSMAWGHEKQICGENLLKWYDGVKRANTDQGALAGLSP